MANGVRCALVLAGLAAGLACCDYRAMWEERYVEALAELGEAKEDQERFYALTDAAKASFEIGKLEEARGFAQEVLNLAPRFTRDWNYGNALHDGRCWVGLLCARALWRRRRRRLLWV